MRKANQGSNMRSWLLRRPEEPQSDQEDRELQLALELSRQEAEKEMEAQRKLLEQYAARAEYLSQQRSHKHRDRTDSLDFHLRNEDFETITSRKIKKEQTTPPPLFDEVQCSNRELLLKDERDSTAAQETKNSPVLSDAESFEIDDVSAWLEEMTGSDPLASSPPSPPLFSSPWVMNEKRRPPMYNGLVRTNSGPGNATSQSDPLEEEEKEEQIQPENKNELRSSPSIDLDAYMERLMAPKRKVYATERPRARRIEDSHIIPQGIECPICSRRFPAEQIERHADRCGDDNPYISSPSHPSNFAKKRQYEDDECYIADVGKGKKDRGKQKSALPKGDTPEHKSKGSKHKPKSMAEAVRKNEQMLKRKQPAQNDYNYYSVNDDALEDEFDTSGFGGYVSGVAWESRGRTHYS